MYAARGWHVGISDIYGGPQFITRYIFKKIAGY
jgi:hypothetical protein